MSVLKQMEDLVNRVNSFEKLRKELAGTFRQVADSLEAVPTPGIPTTPATPAIPAQRTAQSAATRPATQVGRGFTEEQRKSHSRMMKRRWQKAKAAGRNTLA